MQETQLYRPSQVRAIDRYLIEQQGIPGYELMERAAKAAYQNLRRLWPKCRNLVIFCGAGNNGGDGWVLARLAWADDWQVQVYSLSDPESLSGDALTAAREYLSHRGQWEAFNPELKLAALAQADVIVDALLGTGLKGPPRGDFVQAVQLINDAAKPVLAIDIPSGLNGETGVTYEPTVKASHTISFIAHKQGLFTGNAANVVGEVAMASLLDDESDIASLPHGQKPAGLLLQADTIMASIPHRLPSCHKGQAGHVFVIGGDDGMPGAVLMAGHAALRSGAGLCSLFTHRRHAAELIGYRPELMIKGWNTDESWQSDWWLKADVLAMGPGMGLSEWSRDIFSRLISQNIPLVIDADALTLLSEACSAKNWPAVSQRRWLLTPHPGEAARLLNTSIDEVQSDRIQAAKALADRFGATVILKGAGTVITTPDEKYYINPGALGAMASAGMGDVLSGICAALIGQGMTLFAAAKAAVYLHYIAAVAAANGRTRGVLATDLIEQLPDLFPKENAH